jgi:hypothetical protein
MSVDLSTVRFGVADTHVSKVVRAVQKHPRLTALLPAGIEPLVTALKTAQASATAVKALKKPTSLDFAALLDADMKAGKQPDPAELVEQYAAAQREATEIQAVVDRLSMLPARYLADIEREVAAVAETMYDDLGEQLEELLDQGTELLAKLGNVSSADEAIDAKVADAWAEMKEVAARYADLRGAHLALVRAEDSTNFAPNSLGVALLFFAGIERAIPGIAERLTNGPQAGLDGVRRDLLAFPVTEYQNVAHFLGVLRGRTALQPHVARVRSSCAADVVSCAPDVERVLPSCWPSCWCAVAGALACGPGLVARAVGVGVAPPTGGRPCLPCARTRMPQCRCDHSKARH